MKLGVESYTLIDEFEQDFEGTIISLEKLGFKYIEWINLNPEKDPGLGIGLTPAEALKIFNAHGIKLVGSLFVGQNQEKLLFDMDKVQQIIDWHQRAGCTTLGLGGDKFKNEDFFKRRLEIYNKIGAKCKEAGMSWMYHNHFHEQQYINGRPILDQLVDSTDSELVGFDLDIYWCIRGLIDPVEFIERLGNRVKAIHAKDFPFKRLDYINVAKLLKRDEPLTFEGNDYMDLVVPEDFAECGSGIIKWQEVIDAGNRVGCPYIFVEQDYSKYPKIKCLEISKAYLQTLKGITI